MGRGFQIRPGNRGSWATATRALVRGASANSRDPAHGGLGAGTRRDPPTQHYRGLRTLNQPVSAQKLNWPGATAGPVGSRSPHRRRWVGPAGICSSSIERITLSTCSSQADSAKRLTGMIGDAVASMDASPGSETLISTSRSSPNERTVDGKCQYRSRKPDLALSLRGWNPADRNFESSRSLMPSGSPLHARTDLASHHSIEISLEPQTALPE
jgi:hypothetical protein